MRDSHPPLPNDGGAVTVTNDTFSGNSVVAGAAGAIEGDGGTTTVSNSTLNETGAEGGSCNGTIGDGGHNVESDNVCGFGSSDAVSNGNLNLPGSLALNESSGAETLAIGTNSSAYEEVPSGSCTVITDERGEVRPGVTGGGNTACDAGAYEIQGITLTVTGAQVYGSASPTFTVTPTGSLPDGVGISGTPTTCTVNGGTPIPPTLAPNGTCAIDPSSCSPTIALSGVNASDYVLNLVSGAFIVSAEPVTTPSPTAFSIGVNSSTTATVADGTAAMLSETGLPAAATGTVTFAANGTTLCAIGLSGLAGEATSCATSAALAPGEYGVSARYSATEGIFASSNATDSVSLTVSPAGAPPPPPPWPPLPPSTCNGTASPGSVVGIAATADDHGYWIADAYGPVFACGDAANLGGVSATPTDPIAGIVATADGGGYYSVGADGGVFTFGDAVFHGSAGDMELNQSIVGMALDPATGGYWLVAAGGGVFSFDAPFYGSAGNTTLNQPIVGMESNAKGAGYRFVASDGGVFDFGSSLFFGSAVPPRMPSLPVPAPPAAEQTCSVQ